MSLTVLVPGFEGTLRIDGVDGQSSVDGELLRGTYKLSIDAFESRESTIGLGGAPSRVQVRRVSEGVYVVTRHNAWEFTFPPDRLPMFQQSPGAAAISFQGLYIKKIEQLEVALAGFASSQLTVAMTSVSKLSAWGYFAYPKRTQEVDTVEFRQIAHPVYPRVNGIDVKGLFLTPKSGMMSVYFGINQNAVLDHVNKSAATRMELQLDVFGSLGHFDLMRVNGQSLRDDDPSLVFETSPDEAFAAEVRIFDESDCRLPNKRTENGPSHLQITRLEQRGRWLEARGAGALKGDNNDEVKIKQGRAGFPDGETMDLLSNTARLGLHYPIYRRSELPSLGSGYVPQFSYQDPGLSGVNVTEAQTRRNRYYGVRVGSLGNNKTHQSTLDASLAVLSLMDHGDGTEQKFQLQAGKAVNFRGQSDVPSRLVPKENRTEPKEDPAQGYKRIEDIPVEGMILRIDESESRGGESPFVLDTNPREPAQLQFVRPKLLSPPAGATSHQVDQSLIKRLDGKLRQEPDYVRWALGLDGDQRMSLIATSGKVYPVKKDQWSEPFITVGRKDFDLTDMPGVKVGIDKSEELTGIADRTGADRTRITQKLVNGEKRPHYKDVLLHFNFGAPNVSAFTTLKFLPQDKILISEHVDNAIDAFINDAVSDLMIAFSRKLNAANYKKYFKEFVDKHGNAFDSDIYWPVTVVLGALLFEKSGRKYAPEITLGLDSNAMPGMGLNWSNQQAFKPNDHFGFDDAAWKDLAKKDLALWPKHMQLDDDPQAANYSKGSRLDPSHKEWRGFFFRDIPMRLLGDLPSCTNADADPFTLFVCAINKYLVMEYGWLDDSAWTWKAQLRNPSGDPIEFAPTSWQKYVRMRLISFKTTGAGGSALSADGKIEVIFPCITTDGNQDPDHPNLAKALTFSGTFTLDLSNGVELKEVNLSLENAEKFATESFPGFDEIEVERLETDIKTSLNMEFQLKPKPELKKTLPLLDVKNPIKGKFNFNFKTGTPGGEITIPLVIPSEKPSNLFGGLPFSIQSIVLTLNTNGGHAIDVHGRVNLGIGGFGSVGGVLKLRKSGGDWSVDFEPDDISGKIDFGGFKLAGGLGWKKYDPTNPNPDPDGFVTGPVLSGALDSAKERGLWGMLNVTGLFGNDVRLLLTVKNAGEVTYWAGGLLTKNANGWDIGPAKLREPCLVLSHRADKDKLIEDQLANITSDRFNDIFPRIVDESDPDHEKKNEAAARKWLDGWKPSDRVGTMFAASAFLHVNDLAASAPSSDRNINKGDLTTIAFTDSGMVRASGTLRCFSEPIKVAFSYDPGRKRFMVAFQLPEFAYPSKNSPQFVISGGRILLGIGFKRGEEWFRLDVGWPPLLNPDVDQYERDWSQSIKVVWGSFWPINTFWGGAMVEYDTSPRKLFRFGVALRAGWTWQYSVDVGVADGGVSIEIAFGGVVQITIYADGRDAGMPMLSRPVTNRLVCDLLSHTSDLTTLIAKSDQQTASHISKVMRFAEPTLREMNTISGDIAVWLYGDIKGSAWARVLGVKIASIDVHAYARFHGCGHVSSDGFEIRKLSAKAGFRWSVKIGCVEFSGDAEFTITVIDVDKPCSGSRLSNVNMPFLEAAPAYSALPAATESPRITSHVE